jgi:hypothetical protein
MVLLIGGHSGAGKSALAAEIARRTGAAHVEVDDLRMAIQQVTTPDQLPALHFFTSTPGVAKPGIWRRDPDELMYGLIGVAEVVSRALQPVVGYHVTAARPVVLEGDGILPTVAESYLSDGRDGRPPAGTANNRVTAGAVRAVFLVEPELAAVRQRMGAGAEGDTQALMHWSYGQWLRAEAERRGQPVLAPRPYATLLDRVLDFATAEKPDATS